MYGPEAANDIKQSKTTYKLKKDSNSASGW
jgi:hypothetical protein